MSFPLTPRQAQLKVYLIDYAERNKGQCPTHAEIMAGLGVKSKSSVNSLVNGLVERGHAEVMRNRARAIRILEDGK